jgi:hypothetical protein
MFAFPLRKQALEVWLAGSKYTAGILTGPKLCYQNTSLLVIYKHLGKWYFWSLYFKREPVIKLVFILRTRRSSLYLQDYHALVEIKDMKASRW